MAFKSSSESRVVVGNAGVKGGVSFESGWIAKQAGGAVIARAGDTMVLATVCRAQARPDIDFFPLTVEYQERAYAAGRIPGGFFKREGRLSENEILTCRLIDRPIRPFFPKGYSDEVQVICAVLSYDGLNSPDTLAICAASAALSVSEIPFQGPVAAVRVGRINGSFVINPSHAELVNSELDIIVAGSSDAIVMVEGGAKFIPEAIIVDALLTGHEAVKQIIATQQELVAKVSKTKIEFISPAVNQELKDFVAGIVGQSLGNALSITVKKERKAAFAAITDSVKSAVSAKYPEKEQEAITILNALSKDAMRNKVVEEGMRIDGRNLDTVRCIESEVSLLPRVHGSALFTRGETQAIVSVTLGTTIDTQRIDSLNEQSEKSFMLHYNFPPYCTGEVKMMRGTGRREVGHGALAERALRRVIPDQKAFPYVIRIVSDVTESNGSSSMASVCGGTLALMDAGVPILKPIAGVAMGLIKQNEKVAVLTDILGDEDHFGDMDFKVCGSAEGITALQMDIKCSGLSRSVLEVALEKARVARLHILSEMLKSIQDTRGNLSKYAPVIQSFKINPDKIRDIIGPGGKTIKSIVENTGAKIDIDDDGTVKIACADSEGGQRARDIIMGLIEEAEIGRVYDGIVRRIADFGAFVEILPGIEGLVHISQLEHSRVERVSDVVREGDEIKVRVLDIDRQGRIRLSRKDALPDD